MAWVQHVKSYMGVAEWVLGSTYMYERWVEPLCSYIRFLDAISIHTYISAGLIGEALSCFLHAADTLEILREQQQQQ